MTEQPSDSDHTEPSARPSDIASTAKPIRWRWILGFIAVPYVGLCLIGPRSVFTEVPFRLVFGWLIFLGTVVPRVEFNAAQAVLCLLLTLGFAFGLHQLCRHWLSAQWPSAASWEITGITMVAFVAGISLVGIAHQTVWLVRQENILRQPDVIYRTLSRNNLKQIGLAFHHYHDAFDSFPTLPRNSSGLPGQSWSTALLPYLDQTLLAEKMEQQRLATPGDHADAAKTVVATFLNPAIESHHNKSTGLAQIHYAANIQVQATRGLKISEIADGTTNTLLVGEINTEIPAWSAAGNWRDPALGINRVPDGFGSPLNGICHFLLADGSVQAISEDTDPGILRAMATPAGGEVVEY